MTMNEPQSLAGDEQNNTDTGPGKLLRDARERRGWSQQDVARRLNLRLAVIESIDDDHYTAGVALTFLRGYVKAYAKLVGVSEQLALSSFDTMSGTEQLRSAGPAPMQSFSKKTRQQASDKWLKLTSWLVVLGLVASLVFWWWQNSSNGYTESPVIEPASDSATQAPATTQPEPVTEAEPVPEAEPEPANEPAVAPETLSGLSQPAGSEVIAPDTPADTAAAAMPAEPAPDPERLVLGFTADCWIKVTDAEGRVLSEGVKTSSDRLELTGKPPFSLVLGAPQAATVEYLDQMVDLTSFRAGRVARLTVPKS